jgi:hypothetical protein
MEHPYPSISNSLMEIVDGTGTGCSPLRLRTHVGTQGASHRNNTLTRSTGIGMASNPTGQYGVESTPYSGPCVWIMSGAVYFTITINAWGAG